MDAEESHINAPRAARDQLVPGSEEWRHMEALDDAGIAWRTVLAGRTPDHTVVHGEGVDFLYEIPFCELAARCGWTIPHQGADENWNSSKVS